MQPSELRSGFPPLKASPIPFLNRHTKELQETFMIHECKSAGTERVTCHWVCTLPKNCFMLFPIACTINEFMEVCWRLDKALAHAILQMLEECGCYNTCVSILWHFLHIGHLWSVYQSLFVMNKVVSKIRTKLKIWNAFFYGWVTNFQYLVVLHVMNLLWIIE